MITRAQRRRFRLRWVGANALPEMIVLATLALVGAVVGAVHGAVLVRMLNGANQPTTTGR